jgi:hypothetical protein
LRCILLVHWSVARLSWAIDRPTDFGHGTGD